MSTNRFISIDVETANSWFGSICQVGVVEFVDGQIVNEWESLVDPEDDFFEFNTRIHGITAVMVAGQPTFQAVLETVRMLASDSLITSYGHFDRAAFSQACDTRKLPPMANDWLNIQSAVRRAWPDRYATGGYRLNAVCKHLGIPLARHHNALDDARAAGIVLLRACEASGIHPQDWLARNRQPIQIAAASVVNASGPLAGEGIVFTGAMQMARQKAQDLAAAMGCEPSNGVTKKTTILVVGDQDLSRLAGKQKSSKHLKAEELIKVGQEIRIISESDFLAMVSIDEADRQPAA
ncbi:exonuclease domain-containing protein [Pseudomonas sp. p21]|uniref:exonuclease domain-containing protein n=1 Tax=Pseudomonas sp. p21 TaxID=1825979 RepID=UPI0007C677BA|nr:exonuclease domain-containing protein [Pseudomonas sp. p21]